MNHTEIETESTAPSASGSILANLDAEQMAAVTAPIGLPVLVAAGPGSGKTAVISARVAWCIEMGADPSTIAAFTFTNKAAAELKTRIKRSLMNSAGNDPEAQAKAEASANMVYAGTFHSFGARFLRANADRLGLSPKFTIYDRDDSNTAISRLMRAVKNEEAALQGINEVTNSKLGQYVNQRKNNAVAPLDDIKANVDDVYAILYGRYQDALVQAQGLDFNDLVLLPIMIMERNPDLLAAARQQVKHVLVDEYQDTNPNQAKLASMLAGDSTDASIYAVGDPDQSIYGFQFASVGNILNFAQLDYPNAEVYRLNRNYRSQANIVEAANRLISRNANRIDRFSVPQRPPSLPVQIRECSDENSESDDAIKRIKNLKQKGKTRYEDWCIAYRINAQSQPLEAACITHGVPYRVRGGFEFYKRSEITVAVAYLRLALNPDDTVALEQVLNTPRRGIGETARRRLEQYADIHSIHPREALYDMATSALSFEQDAVGRKTTDRTKAGAQQLLDVLDELAEAAGKPEPASAVMETLLHGSCGMEEYCRTQPGDGENRWSNLNRLWEMAKQHQGELTEFCDHMRLFQREDPSAEEGEEDRITLSTLHQTKGLEWPNVLIISMEQGSLPHFMSKTATEKEEERRLFYVGCTRAKDRLFISHSRRRGNRTQQRSQFLQEMSPNRTPATATA